MGWLSKTIYVVAFVLMLVFVVASNIYTANKPYNLLMMRHVPLWAWLCFGISTVIMVIFWYREVRR